MPLFLSWDAMVYGSGHPSAGGSGVAPDGSESMMVMEKWLTELIIARADLMKSHRREAFRYEIAQVQAEVDVMASWRNLTAALEETRGKDAREILSNATTAYGDMLQTKRDLDTANGLRVGRAVQTVRDFYTQVPGASVEDALDHALRDPQMQGLVVGDPALPQILDQLKEMYAGSYDPETHTYKSFAELGTFPSGGRAGLLSQLLRLEADAENSRRQVQVAGKAVDDLGSSLAGIRGDVEAGRAVDMTELANKAKAAVLASSSAAGGKTLKQAEAELAEVAKEDDALKAMNSSITRLQAKIDAGGEEGATTREQMGVIMAGPKLQRWAKQKHLHIGTSEVKEVKNPDGTMTRTLVPGSYQEGRDDAKAVMLWLREQQHPPEHRWQVKDTGLLVRVQVGDTSPEFHAGYRMPNVEGLPGVNSKYARIAETKPDGSTAYTYLDPAQVSAILAANKQQPVVGRGAPEVFAAQGPEGTVFVRVNRRGQDVHYSVDEQGIMHLMPTGPAAETSWLPLMREGRYLSSAGLHDGKKVPEGSEVVSSEEERKQLVGNPEQMTAALDRGGVELTDEPPSRDAYVSGALVSNDPNDASGVVRVSTGTGLMVLGTDPARPVKKVEIVGEKQRGGILSIQSAVRGRRAERQAREAGKETPADIGTPVDLIGGVEVVDMRAAGAPEDRPWLARVVDAASSALAPEPDIDIAERAGETAAAKRGRREAEERRVAAEQEVPTGKTAAETEAEAFWGPLVREERLKALRGRGMKAAPAPTPPAPAQKMQLRTPREIEAAPAPALPVPAPAPPAPAPAPPVPAPPPEPERKPPAGPALPEPPQTGAEAGAAAAGGRPRSALAKKFEEMIAPRISAQFYKQTPTDIVVEGGEQKPPTQAGAVDVTPTGAERKESMDDFRKRVQMLAAQRAAIRRARGEEEEETKTNGGTSATGASI